MEKNDVLEWLHNTGRPRHVNQADQAMLDPRTHVLKNLKLRDSSKRLPDHHDTTSDTEDADRKDDNDRSAAYTIQQDPYSKRHSDCSGKPPTHVQQGRSEPTLKFKISDCSVKPPTHLQKGRTLREPTLEFKIESVPAPDFDWLNDTEGFEEQGPARVFRKTPKRAPPSTVVQQCVRSFRTFLKDLPVVWRRGDDA